MVSFRKSVKFKKFLTNASIVLTALLTFFILLETASSTLTTKGESVECKNCELYIPNTRYGYVPKPNSVVEVSQTCGSDPCFKAKYQFDRFGRRTIGLNVNSDRHLLMFGCSVTFGAGLNDEDTLPYQLQKRSSARVYNYAKMGSGPAHALALLESSEFQSEVNEKLGMALYFLLPFHTGRVSLNTETTWLWPTPAYEIDSSGEAVFSGSQASPHPFLHKMFGVYNYLRSQFSFLQMINREFDANSFTENEDLVVAILKKSKIIYERKFAGEFLIVAPRALPDSLKEKIANAGLQVISINNSGTPEEGYVCRCDKHPNGKRNRFIADALANAISLNPK